MTRPFSLHTVIHVCVRPGPPVGAPAGAFPQIIAYQGKGIQIRMDFAKAPGNASMTAINAMVVTNQPSVTGFQMQAAVPKYIRMQMVCAHALAFV